MADGAAKYCVKCGVEREPGVRCRPCNLARYKAHYAAHSERWKAYDAKRIAEYHDDILEAKKRYRERNPHKILADNRKFKLANPEYSAEWAKANPELCRARTRRYRVRKFEAEGSHTVAEWLAIVARQGGKCAICKELPKKGLLEEEHMIPLSRGGSDWATNIQGVCRNCNASKTAKTPHEFEAWRKKIKLKGVVS